MTKVDHVTQHMK